MTAGLVGWLLFGHLIGVAVLAAGVGAYVAGLHQLAAAADDRGLRAARPTLRWGEQLTFAGFGLLVLTGVGLVAKTSTLGEAWLLTSLALLVLVAGVGRVSGSRLDALFAARDHLPLRQARSLAIHLPADVTVVAVLEIIYLMTGRPGWWGIVVSLAICGLLVLGAAWALRRGSTAEVPGRAEATP